MVQTVRTTTRHHRAARTSLGELGSPADTVYLLGLLSSLAIRTANDDRGRTNNSVKLQSRQQHQLVVAIATGITGEAGLADFDV